MLDGYHVKSCPSKRTRTQQRDDFQKELHRREVYLGTGLAQAGTTNRSPRDAMGFPISLSADESAINRSCRHDDFCRSASSLRNPLVGRRASIRHLRFEAESA